MVSSLQNFAENAAEKIHKIKCKYVHDNNKYEACTIKYKDFECFLQYWNVKADLINTNIYVTIRITQKRLLKT